MNHDDEFENIFDDVDESNIIEESTVEPQNNNLLGKAAENIINNRIDNYKENVKQNNQNIQNNSNLNQNNIQDNTTKKINQNQNNSSNENPLNNKKLNNINQLKTWKGTPGAPGLKQKLQDAKALRTPPIRNISKIFNSIGKAKDEQENIELGNQEAKKIAMNGSGTGNSISKIKNATADPQMKKELASMVAKKILNSKITLIALGASIIIVILIIFVSVILSSVSDDESESNTSKEVTGIVTGDLTFDDVTEYLVRLGLCQSYSDKTEEIKQCESSGYGQFLVYFKSVYSNYQMKEDKNDEPIKLDIPLLLETISYYRADNTIFSVLKTESETPTSNGRNAIYIELDDLAEALVEEAEEYGDLYSCSGVNCSSCSVDEDATYKRYFRISDDKYISFLKYGKVHENYSNKPKRYDVDIHPNSDSKCIPDGRAYNPPSDERYVAK